MCAPGAARAQTRARAAPRAPGGSAGDPAIPSDHEWTFRPIRAVRVWDHLRGILAPGADEGEEREMFWQFIVLVVATIGFPTATLLFLIGGPRFPDEKRGD
nr:hypothetical protein KPHV_42320 [Kitasatospora purpeofusca]